MKFYIKRAVTATAITISFLTFYCGPETNKTHASESEREKIQVNSYALNTARFLAGVELKPGSKLASFAESKTWQSYKTQLDKSWATKKKGNLKKIQEFSKENLRKYNTRNLFYPFGGPDMMNAVAFYPDAKEYILMGLEPTRSVPDPLKIGKNNALKGLTHLKGTLTEILGHNFFHTKIMAYEIGSHSLSGISSVVSHFLVRSGYDVISIDDIYIDDAGKDHVFNDQVKKDKTKPNAAHGIRLRFVTLDSKSEAGENSYYSDEVKTIFYFPGDASDASFGGKTGLVKFLTERKGMTTMLKAASYLMFNDNFDDMRAFIMGYSDVIMSDASGIPYHFLKSNKAFDVTLYGEYVRPIHLFRLRCQPDLAKDIKTMSQGKLGFSYGYTSARYSHTQLIFAVRKKNANYHPPKFDKTNSRGTSTTCSGNKLNVNKH